jgi:hypothetical protein
MEIEPPSTVTEIRPVASGTEVAEVPTTVVALESAVKPPTDEAPESSSLTEPEMITAEVEIVPSKPSGESEKRVAPVEASGASLLVVSDVSTGDDVEIVEQEPEVVFSPARSFTPSSVGTRSRVSCSEASDDESVSCCSDSECERTVLSRPPTPPAVESECRSEPMATGESVPGRTGGIPADTEPALSD